MFTCISTCKHANRCPFTKKGIKSCPLKYNDVGIWGNNVYYGLWGTSTCTSTCKTNNLC